MPIASTERLTAAVQEGWPQAEEPRARLLAEALVRLAISYVTAPSDSPEATAASVAALLGPYIDQALGIT